MKPIMHRRKVAVIGEHRASEHPFILTLKSHPLIEFTSVNHLHKSELGGADLVVHIFPTEEDRTYMIPDMPLIYVIESTDVDISGELSESLWRDTIFENATMEEFNHKLGRMLELVTIQRQRDEMLRRERLFDRYVSRLDLTQPSAVIMKIVQLVGESTRAKNVCWISGDIAQAWWSQANRRKSLLSVRVMEERMQCFWWRPDSASLEELMQRAWPLAAIGRDWLSGEMLHDEKSNCGLLRLVAERSGVDLGYVVIDQPKRLLRSGRRIFRKLEQYLHYALLFEENQRLIYIDDLTSLYNQRYLPLVINSEISRARRENKKLSILFLDVDYFKSVNDSRGHLVGSKLLVEMSKLIRTAIRGYDYAFRYGGDEFVVILPNADTQDARLVAERIRSRVEQTDFLVYQKHYKVTVSVGVATFPDHAATAEQVLQLADEAMYNAKKASRNIVYIAS